MMPQIFFKMLRSELAFYIGCLNLYEQLQQIGMPVCFPIPLAPTKRHRSIRGMYDVSLALQIKAQVVGNDFSADNQSLFIVT